LARKTKKLPFSIKGRADLEHSAGLREEIRRVGVVVVFSTLTGGVALSGLVDGLMRD
jgi:hypothetical protein